MEESGYGALGVFVALNIMAASSGAFFRPGDWYEELNRPRWRPPNWLFAPAWSVLYLLNSIAGWLVWRAAPADEVTQLMGLYGISLMLNAAWSGIFFGLRRMDLAFAELLILWASILAMILIFAKVDSRAAQLLYPYLAWVSFAGALNFAMWRMNRAAMA
jgi:tryptophan-rich sensory protein